MDYNQTLKEIVTNLHKLGDLPVFSATVNQIRLVSSSDEADAMALAMAVMKDVNLSVRVLKLANTPTFNPKNREISSLSRAVVQLGFEHILNLAMTLKLVESLRDANPDKQLDQLLVQAFLNASIARELAEVANLRKAEGVYLNGLLHNLGEILVAYTLPERYQEIRSTWKGGERGWSDTQLQILGSEFSDIGQEFAESWGFPKPLVQSMDRYTANRLTGRDQAAHQIAVGSSDLLNCLYQQGDKCRGKLSHIFSHLSKQLNLSVDQLEESVLKAYKLTAVLAEEVGVPTASLKPKLSGIEDEAALELCEEISFFLHSRDETHRADQAPTPLPAAPKRSSAQLLDALAAFDKLIAAELPAMQLVDALLRAVIENSDLERALFLMQRKDGKGFTAKLTEGTSGSKLAESLQKLSDEASQKLLVGLMRRGTTLMVSDLSSEQWRSRLPESLLQATQSAGLIISSLKVAERPLGLLYFDTQLQPLADADYAVVNQFLLLLRNALEGRARSAD